ncbi:MAG: D-glycero-beta-D-manno-heptose 1-phosphate adenylyltransferase [Bacteroidetes bacterium]|nr:D-glycero-beta-D-manno-heptose 1-phosphate adenylyltransferase [Bacteroidota bacterium]
MNHELKLRNKIYSLQSLIPMVQQWKAAGKKIVFTNGCFDLLHPGHVDYLTKAADLGDKLIIALNTDASVQQLKGVHRPIQNEQSRLHIMAALECVSAVFLFDEDTPLAAINKIIPQVLVKGGDYTLETIVGAEVVTAQGGEVKIIPFLEGYSTSAIEQKIKAQ